MKILNKFKSLLLFLIFFLVLSPAWATTKYLRNVTTTNWNVDASWSTNSDGVDGDTTFPTSADDVILNATASTTTLTVNVASACKSLTMTDFGGTLTGTSRLEVSGNLIVGAGGSYSSSSTFAFKFVASGTITSNATTVNIPITIDGAGITVQLGDALNIGTKTLTVTQGTFTTNNYQVDCGTFGISGTGVKVITLGSSTVNCSRISFEGGTNLTLNADTSTINCAGTFNSYGKTYYVVNLSRSATGFSSITSTTGSFTATTVNFIGYADKVSGVEIGCNITTTNLSIDGNSVTNRIWIKSDITGTQRTLAVTTLVSLTNVDFQDIAVTGTASPLTGTSIGDAGNISGITRTTPVTATWIDTDGGSWSATGSWDTGIVPLCHDDVVFNAGSITSGSRTVAIDMPRIGKDITMTNVANSPTFSASLAFYVFGSWLSGVSHITGSTMNCPTFESRTPINVDFSKETSTTNMSIYFNTFGTTTTLTGNIISDTSYVLKIFSGTLDLNDFNVTIGKVYSTGDLTRTLQLGNGTITLKGSGATTIAPWYTTGSNYAVTCEGSTILFNSTAATNKEFNGGGLTYNKLKFAGSGNPMVISGNNTFTTLEVDSSAGANTLTLTSTSNQTVTNFITNGSAGKLITLNSSTPGSAATLTCSQPNQFFRGVTFQDIAFAGSVWYYDNLSTKGTGNSGRIFPWLPL